MRRTEDKLGRFATVKNNQQFQSKSSQNNLIINIKWNFGIESKMTFKSSKFIYYRNILTMTIIIILISNP